MPTDAQRGPEPEQEVRPQPRRPGMQGPGIQQEAGARPRCDCYRHQFHPTPRATDDTVVTLGHTGSRRRSERRWGLSPGRSPLASPRASPAAVIPRGASAATRNEHLDHRAENPGSLAVASVAEGAAAAEDPWVDFKMEEDPFGDPAAVCHEVVMAGRELPTAPPRNIAQTNIHPVVVQTAAIMRVNCERASK